MKKKQLVSAALIFPVLLFGVSFLLFPLEMVGLKHRFGLWRAGVIEVRAAGLHGYLNDHCGKGPCECLLLIHGLGDHAITWNRLLASPARSWAKPVKIYAFDLPGTEPSDPVSSPDGYETRHQAEAVRKALEPLCPRWTVVGNSLGGWIGAWLALQWKEGVKNLVLVDSAGLKALEEKRDFLLQKPSIEWVKAFRKMIYFRPPEIPWFAWREVIKLVRQSNARDVVLAQKEEDLLDNRLSALRVPTAIFWGEEDQLIPLAQGKKLQSLIAGATWKQVPRCSHIPQKECPEPLIQTINETLTR